MDQPAGAGHVHQVQERDGPTHCPGRKRMGRISGRIDSVRQMSGPTLERLFGKIVREEGILINI